MECHSGFENCSIVVPPNFEISPLGCFFFEFLPGRARNFPEKGVAFQDRFAYSELCTTKNCIAWSMASRSTFCVLVSLAPQLSMFEKTTLQQSPLELRSVIMKMTRNFCRKSSNVSMKMVSMLEILWEIWEDTRVVMRGAAQEGPLIV